MVLKVKLLNSRGGYTEIRIRKNRRIAIRLLDLPTPPPRVVLKCMGEELEMRYATKQFGFAVYYMPAKSWRRFVRLLLRYRPLPCVIMI
jgi:hypothetical protein